MVDAAFGREEAAAVFCVDVFLGILGTMTP